MDHQHHETSRKGFRLQKRRVEDGFLARALWHFLRVPKAHRLLISVEHGRDNAAPKQRHELYPRNSVSSNVLPLCFFLTSSSLRPLMLHRDAVSQDVCRL